MVCQVCQCSFLLKVLVNFNLKKNLCDCCLLPSRYQDKEGWAPASYLKKVKDDLSPRKKTVTGPVEIIGNIMEISNLLNKKTSSEKDVQTEGVPESPQVARKEISLPILCSDSSPINAAQEAKSKAEPASPAVARIAPHRVEIGQSLLMCTFLSICLCTNCFVSIINRPHLDVFLVFHFHKHSYTTSAVNLHSCSAVFWRPPVLHKSTNMWQDLESTPDLLPCVVIHCTTAAMDKHQLLVAK